MKVLVTGAKGFIGKNLIAELDNIKKGKTKAYSFLEGVEYFECDLNTPYGEFSRYCKECDFVIHLAGVNRPEKPADFMAGNFGFTTILISALKEYGNKAPILMSSSVQAVLDNDYGKSKKAGEDYIINYGKENGVKTYVYRLPNVFGKWCRPNYNSAVATFCNNIANDLPITVNSRETELTLAYIDDVVRNFLNAINDNVIYDGDYAKIDVSYKATLGKITDLLYLFKKSRENLELPDTKDEFTGKLYATYLSYLPEDKFSYPLTMHEDYRGSFTEFLHTSLNGQVSVNISKPRIVKGEHWHHTKNEKFLVVSGKGVIRFRKVGEEKVTEYFVSGDKLEVVDIPCGYTHNIENLGDTDMVTIMWCNETFNPEKPDTYYLKVEDKNE